MEGVRSGGWRFRGFAAVWVQVEITHVDVFSKRSVDCVDRMCWRMVGERGLASPMLLVFNSMHLSLWFEASI